MSSTKIKNSIIDITYEIECISDNHEYPQTELEINLITKINTGIQMYKNGRPKTKLEFVPVTKINMEFWMCQNCYKSCILTLNKYVDIQQPNVEYFETEKDLFRAFAKIIQENNPGLLTNLNMFNLNNKYIYNRIRTMDIIEAERQGYHVDHIKNKFMDEFLQIMGEYQFQKFIYSITNHIKISTYNLQNANDLQNQNNIIINNIIINNELTTLRESVIDLENKNLNLNNKLSKLKKKYRDLTWKYVNLDRKFFCQKNHAHNSKL